MKALGTKREVEAICQRLTVTIALSIDSDDISARLGVNQGHTISQLSFKARLPQTFRELHGDKCNDHLLISDSLGTLRCEVIEEMNSRE